MSLSFGADWYCGDALRHGGPWQVRRDMEKWVPEAVGLMASVVMNSNIMGPSG